jgi:hypothetical protein
MRNLKLTLLAALTIALGASTAQAASVDVIWQISGTATTTVAPNSIVAGTIILTPTTPLAGAGSVVELSADTIGVLTLGAAQTTFYTGWIALGSPTIANPHSENVIAQGDLFGTLPVAAPTVFGEIVVDAGLLGGSVTVQASGPGDDIFAGANSVLGEYVFNAGIVNIPEPTTASLLSLGLIGLTVVGRRRQR